VGDDSPRRRPEVRARAVTALRVVQVLPDVSALDRAFDYEVPEKFDAAIRVGSVVRIDLHGRRVRGWVIAEGAGAARDVALKPVAKISPGFVDPELVDLSTWAAWRWAGKRRTFLSTATESSRTGSETARKTAESRTSSGESWAGEALARPRSVLRLGPAIDPWPVIEAAAARGPALVLLPSLARVERLQRRLREAGIGGVVVGARAGAWAACPGLTSVVVIDAHDEVYSEERAPTWNAWVVAAERAARAGVPCVLVTPTPTQEHVTWGEVVETDRATERRGWARIEIVDRRGDDPRTGLWSSRVVDVVRGGGRVLCILNRTGRAKLLRCGACGTVATCERCASAVRQDADKQLVCDRCAMVRPTVCTGCGSSKLAGLRIGTAKAAEELAALVGAPVGEVTGASSEVPDTPVLVGTEALLHRVGRADAVVFVDLDAELSAPHFRANEAALALLARASRIVRGRTEDGRVVLQTRQPDHPVLAAAVASEPQRLAEIDAELRRELRLPPFSAVAQVSGEGAATVADAVRGQIAIEVIGPDNHDAYLVRAPEHAVLCDALAAVERPAERVRISVDPVRV
jgi:primosomal protein N' (replication factor Y) (superfamily II helicase)